MRPDSLEEIIDQLKSISNPADVEGMARFGISAEKTFGIRIPVLRKMAKNIIKEAKAGESDRHLLALELWDSGYHEARILASMIDDCRQVDERQMDKWVADFDSWDVCDQCCMNLFVYTELAVKKAIEWSTSVSLKKFNGYPRLGEPDQNVRCKADERRGECAYEKVRNRAAEEDNAADDVFGCAPEFVKRAGFAMMACMAWKLKTAPDELFDPFFPIIKQESTDNRNFVKKAVNWALRQIGKRNKTLNKKAIETAREIQSLDNKTANWIATDTIRELTSEEVQSRLA